MTKLEKLRQLNRMLIGELPEYQAQGGKFPHDESSQQRLFRSLMNVRPPMAVSGDYGDLQDDVLQQTVAEKGVVTLSDLTPIQGNLYLWQGDITRLGVDAIVNAANSALLGCFIPCHGCIDNAIHSVAGVQLRCACQSLMQGGREPTGCAKITKGYNLPCKYVIHTVGPIIGGDLTKEDCDLLSSCYRSCLELAIQKGLQTIAFCCISTGEFHFPNDIACQIAVDTVESVLRETQSEMKVIFNVFKDHDYQLYGQRLGAAKG